ncbi:unnamed protein product [Amaranthus hypochondriacus]
MKKKKSKEEEKIRGELEMDIERALEVEIKEEICRLAVRLHRLYQHRTHAQNHSNKNNKEVSGFNITIKLDGGTKVEVKEINKKNIMLKQHVINTPNNTKKFDWANSLRSSRPPPKNSKNIWF